MQENYAGGGRRILGGMIDLIILLLFFVFYVIVFGKRVGPGSYHITGLSAFILFIIIFLYFVFLEKLWGKTLGKLIVKTRVVNELNQKISWGQAIARNVIRPIDTIFLGIIGIIAIASTDKKQRLGDLLARTYVIKD